MNENSQEKKVIPSIGAGTEISWRELAAALAKNDVKEAALYLDTLPGDERREIYRTLKECGLSLPYIHLNPELEGWEIDYLKATYPDCLFGLTASVRSFALLAGHEDLAAQTVIENPSENDAHALFTDESLEKAGVAGICLDVATLEHDRLDDEARYQDVLRAVDHHGVRVTQIGPVAAQWYKRISKTKRRLTSLSDLRYLQHAPASCFGALVILEADNFIEEQLEIVAYLRSVLKK